MLIKTGDRKTIGSKAFDLYRCSLLDVEVPEFYVIPTQYYRKCTGKKFPKRTRDELQSVFTSLGGTVAVRSSSVVEDLGTRSNAGKFKTVLGVKSLPELIRAIRTVWRSSNGQDMAVIIQKQLAPEVAGVLFTSNPLNGKSETVLEYVSGLGIKLVSGKCNPKMLIFDNNPSMKQYKFWGELVRISKDLKTYFGYPLDIEWAWCEKKFHILQARPITNLPPPERHLESTYSRVQAEQFYSGPVSPLFFSIFNFLYSKYYMQETLEAIGVQIPMEEVLVRYKNHMYVNTSFAEYVLTHLPLGDSSELLLEVLPEDIREDIITSHCNKINPDVLKLLKFILFHPKYWISNLDRYFEEKVAPKIVARLETLKDFEKMGRCELKATYQLLIDTGVQHIRTSKWGLVLYILPMISAMKRFLIKNSLEPQYLTKLITGLGLNKTLDASLELKKLAWRIRSGKAPKIFEIFRKEFDDYQNYKNELEATAAGERILDGFELILKRFGHRRLSRDILTPSWNDEPMIPFSILRKLVLDENLKLEDSKKTSVEQRLFVANEIKQHLPARKIWVFETLSNYLVRYIAFREYQRFYLDMILSKFRGLILAISRSMVEDAILKDIEDIFFLELTDVLDYLDGKKNLKLMKKVEFYRISYKDITTSPGRYLRGGVDFNYIKLSSAKKLYIQEQPSLEPEQIIKGEAVSPGYFTGRARIIEFIDNASKLEPNEVIITRCIDPGQTHVFLLAGALVFEVGGMLSHGAILAREFNLPTVARIKDATRLFKTGQRITVDGTKGMVVVKGKNDE